MARKGSGKANAGKDYAIGYGKPPVHTRFKPGETGNPRGKEKGHKGLKAVVESVFQEKVSIRTARGLRKVTKLDALVQKLMNDALRGDAQAVMHIVRLAKEAGLTQEAGAIEAASFGELLEEDHRIMARWLPSRGDDE